MYRKQHSIYRVWCHLVSTGCLGKYPLQIRGNYSILKDSVRRWLWKRGWKHWPVLFPRENCSHIFRFYSLSAFSFSKEWKSSFLHSPLLFLNHFFPTSSFKIPSPSHDKNTVPSLKSSFLCPYLPETWPLAQHPRLHPHSCHLYGWLTHSSQFTDFLTLGTVFFCPVLANLLPPPLSTSISGSYSILSYHHFWNFISRTSLLNPHLQFFQLPRSCSNSPTIPRPPIHWPTFLSINNSIPSLLLSLPSLNSALQYYDHSIALSPCLIHLANSNPGLNPAGWLLCLHVSRWRKITQTGSWF